MEKKEKISIDKVTTIVAGEQLLKEFEYNVEIALRTTQSLLRCAHYARRDSTGSQDGLKRAFKAARERIKQI